MDRTKKKDKGYRQKNKYKTQGHRTKKKGTQGHTWTKKNTRHRQDKP